MNEKLLLIGVDGLDWTGFRAAVGAGLLPGMAALAARGAAGRLASPAPPGPAAWTTVATGVAPPAHGVVHAGEAWAGGLRPVGAASWRRRPVWERLARAGVPTLAVAWPATRPGAGWRGVQVDDRLGDVSGLSADDWPLPLDIAPADLREAIRAVRVHAADLPLELLAPLAPSPSSALRAAVARRRSNPRRGAEG